MLAELSKYNRLGCLEEIIYILNEAISKEPKSIENILDSGLRNSINLQMPIKGILALLCYLSLVDSVEEKIFINSKGEEIIKLSSSQDIARELIIILLMSLNDDSFYNDLFTQDNIRYNSAIDSFVIRNSQIHLKYSNIKNLLINLGFFARHNELSNNLLAINKDYLEFIKQSLKKVRVKKTLEELKEMLEKNEEYGKIAELFVLEYEKMRLQTHPCVQNIKRVSEIDVNAGYDIISYNTLESTQLDRFIEVKSHRKKPGFFWTRNEIEVSRIKKETYYLYLVDRDSLNKPGYNPIIINNPYFEVFHSDEWFKESQEWFVSRL